MEGLRRETITDALEGSRESWTFGDLVGNAPHLAMRYNRHNARVWTCQRVLDAVLNVVIDVKACAFKIDNEGIEVAHKIAAKATPYRRGQEVAAADGFTCSS